MLFFVCERMEKIKSSKGVIEINYDHFYDGDDDANVYAHEQIAFLYLCTCASKTFQLTFLFIVDS